MLLLPTYSCYINATLMLGISYDLYSISDQCILCYLHLKRRVMEMQRKGWLENLSKNAEIFCRNIPRSSILNSLPLKCVLERF